MATRARVVCVTLMFLFAGCRGGEDATTVVTFPASRVGKEAELLRRQLEQFQQEHPGIHVDIRDTPDAADQRHQLYVQWLNARTADPDILQLDVIWTAEFAAAGWILPFDQTGSDVDDFFPATLAANRWQGSLYALPWFVDVGMLYYRADLIETAPESFAELARQAAEAMKQARIPYGFLWQGARYEGLVCVFLEHLGGFGGEILDEHGEVVVDSDAAVRALRYMCDSVHRHKIVPESTLTWQEEQTRFGFQNGQAVFLRNWPYAYSLMEDPAQSNVSGQFRVAVMPASGGSPTAALGGSQLAINANTEHPEAAYSVIKYLTEPEQMLERAQMLGQFPPRRSLYDQAVLAEALPIPPQEVRQIIERAVPRPVTPVYSQLSEILQIWLHRALTRQAEPEEALANAADEMRRLLAKVGL